MIRRRSNVCYHASRSSRPPRWPLLPRWRGARVGPTLPSPCAPLCSRIAPAHLVLFGPRRAGGPPLPPLRRPVAIAMPVPWGPLHCCEAFFSYPCFGAFPAPIALWRNSVLIWPPLLFPPMAGCPCRAPAGAPSPAPSGTPPLGALASLGTSVAPRGFFSAGAVFSGQGVRGFPLGAVARGLPPCPPARAPAICTHFLSRAGLGDCVCRARGPCPCAPRGGRARLPPAPPAAPTRGAVFFIVFCSA